MSDPSPISFVLLKIASRCNINCTYCYWFKDPSVYEGSKIMTDAALEEFYIKLRRHIIKHGLKSFSVSLHGGEPLLAGKKKVKKILDNLFEIKEELGIKLSVLLQTNGILIDNEWADLFIKYNVSVGISIDGPQEIHDMYRVDLQGQPTFQKVVNGINVLKDRGMDIGVLAVCNPMYDPEVLCDFFVNTLKLKSFDILMPDTSHEAEDRPFIKEFYKKLFALWYDKYYGEGVNIRVAKNILKGLLGRHSSMQAIGYNPVNICVIRTDGELEALDFLNVLGYNTTKSNKNIIINEIDDVREDDFWQKVYSSSLNLHEKCLSCKYNFACGGGHISSRWSDRNGFDNPSAYCDQLYDIFDFAFNHVSEKIQCQSVLT